MGDSLQEPILLLECVLWENCKEVDNQSNWKFGFCFNYLNDVPKVLTLVHCCLLLL